VQSSKADTEEMSKYPRSIKALLSPDRDPRLPDTSALDRTIANFCGRYLVNANKAIFAGRGIFHNKCFIDRDFPLLKKFASHRIVEMSSLDVIYRSWNSTSKRSKSVRRSKTMQTRGIERLEAELEKLTEYTTSWFKTPQEKLNPEKHDDDASGLEHEDDTRIFSRTTKRQTARRRNSRASIGRKR